MKRSFGLLRAFAATLSSPVAMAGSPSRREGQLLQTCSISRLIIPQQTLRPIIFLSMPRSGRYLPPRKSRYTAADHSFTVMAISGHKIVHASRRNAHGTVHEPLSSYGSSRPTADTQPIRQCAINNEALLATLPKHREARHFRPLNFLYLPIAQRTSVTYT